MFMRILEITLPVFGIALIGYLYARARHISMENTNQINLELFIPALLFFVLSEKIPAISDVGTFALGGAIVVLGSGIVLYPLCRWLNLPSRSFLSAMMFNNSGNLGLPLAVFTFGAEALPAAVILFVVQVTLQFTVGMWMMAGRTDPIALMKNPILISIVAGIIANRMDWHVPTLLMPGLDMLAQVSVPVMLVALGARLTSLNINDLKSGLLGAVMCPLSGVLMALLAVFLFDYPQQKMQLLVLFGALPPAVMNVMLAEKFKQNPTQMASVVAAGNLFSLISIPLVLAFLI